MSLKAVSEWTQEDVLLWLDKNGYSEYKELFVRRHEIDGKALLTLREEDLKSMNIWKIGELKRLSISIKQLQRDNIATLFDLGCIDLYSSNSFYSNQRHEVRQSHNNCYLNCRNQLSLVVLDFLVSFLLTIDIDLKFNFLCQFQLNIFLFI